MDMNKIEREKLVVDIMIGMFCRHKEGNQRLCPECTALLEYAHNRLRHCPFGAGKGSCRKCPVHCYRADMAERIRAVMRYAGPRMLLRHPLYAVIHLLSELRHR